MNAAVSCNFLLFVIFVLLKEDSLLLGEESPAELRCTGTEMLGLIPPAEGGAEGGGTDF